MYKYKCPKCKKDVKLVSYEIYSLYKDKPCSNCSTKPILLESDKEKPNPQIIYKEQCWKLTELQDLTQLPYHKKRAFRGYHLDHIVPIYQGYKLTIPATKIASLENLRFIPCQQNINKGIKLTNLSKELLTRWEVDFS